MKWPEYNLKEIADVTMGQSPPGTTYNENGSGLPFFQGKAEFGHIYPTVRKWCTAPSRVAKQGDILLSVRAPVGPTNLAPCECCIGRGLAAIRAKEGVVEQKYLWFFFKQLEPILSKRGQGSTFKAIKRAEINAIPIPLPPLSEQRRIVEILDQADALRKKRAEADAKAARILFALFIKSFGNPLTNPMGWREVRLGRCCDIVTGNTPSTKKAEYYGKDILWARPADLDNQILVTRTEKMLSTAGGKVARIVPQNSVLVVCIGATLGKVALAGAKMAINQQINAALPSDRLLPEFLYVQCALLADRFRAAATKSTLPILNKSHFSNQKILCPPKEKQKAFVRAARTVITSHDTRAASRKLLESLFQSLLHLAFKSDLTAKWRDLPAAQGTAQAGAHMKELLEEMEQQTKVLETPISEDRPAPIRIKRNKRRAEG